MSFKIKMRNIRQRIRLWWRELQFAGNQCPDCGCRTNTTMSGRKICPNCKARSL